MNYIVKGLPVEPFQHLFGKSDEDLMALGVRRYIADEKPGFPDRIEMRDVDIGQTVLLLNHVSMDMPSPYRATHAIFVREGAAQSFEAQNQIPPVMYDRMLSLRAFDEQGMIVDAALAKGDDIEMAVKRFFENENVSFIDAHNASRGCYSATIVRG